ncbi:28S ribosomal protein S33, mitochondrial [Contarinia nasturtii]|uniref:28S ribosomal protein S33, mitochondrial n=1 Tax=Contarinia nasturtii TaxID=265458 RepID=UPI0012D3C61E|nr:28S ribosomal protein S33, mitochondrial [Contarinia nasturtii]
MSKFVNVTKYAKLVNANSEYGRRMKHLSNRIFGEVTRPTTSQSMKVVQMFREEPLYLRDNVINYYPRHIEMGQMMLRLREYGLFRDEHADFREESKRLKALRGKGPPPRKTKEEGKRWKKKQQKLAEEAEAAAKNA